MVWLVLKWLSLLNLDCVKYLCCPFSYRMWSDGCTAVEGVANNLCCLLIMMIIIAFMKFLNEN